MVLPDFSNRVPWGTTTGTYGYIEAGLPNITGTLRETDMLSSTIRTGCFYDYGSGTSVEGGGASSAKAYTGFDASRCSSIYGNSSTVQPPAIRVLCKARYI